MLAGIAIRRGEKPGGPLFRELFVRILVAREGEKAAGKRLRTMLRAFRRLRNCPSLKSPTCDALEVQHCHGFAEFRGIIERRPAWKREETTNIVKEEKGKKYNRGKKSP